MNAYDPYNGVSYLELNKRRRGEQERTEEDKIYNRPPPAIKKIYVKLSDAQESSAKFFIWKKWQLPGLKNLIQEAGAHLGMDRDAATRMYDSRGIEILDEEQIFDGMIYIVAGNEKLDFSENGEARSVQQQRQRPEYDLLKVHSSYSTVPNTRRTEAAEKSDRSRSMSTVAERHDRANEPRTGSIATALRTALQKRFRRRDSDKLSYSVPATASWPTTALTTARKNNAQDNDWEPPPRPYESVHHNYGFMDRYGDLNDDPLEAIRRNRKNLPTEFTAPDDEPEPDRPLETKSANSAWKNGEILDNHKKKVSAMRRSRSAVIYNRRDQTHPDAYIIYVFLNGHGMQSQYIHFQRGQLEKGMNFILEIIARRFGIKPDRLCNMDGKRVRNVDELMSRGAYVLVPAGQSFWTTWYFLPDNAIDTSFDPERAEQLRIQRERLIQLRERHQAAIRANLKSNATQYVNSKINRARAADSANLNYNSSSWKQTNHDQGHRHEGTRPEADQHRRRKDEVQRGTNLEEQVRPGQYFLNVHPRR